MMQFLIVLLFVLIAQTVKAQSATSYTLTITNNATNAVVSTTIIQATAFTCNQPALSGSTVNPRHIGFIDPVNNPTGSPTGAYCVFTDNGLGPLGSLPLNNNVYTATLSATNSLGTSSNSLPSLPFTEPGLAPGAPMGFKVVQ